MEQPHPALWKYTSHIASAGASVRASGVDMGLPVVQVPFAPAKLETKKTVEIHLPLWTWSVCGVT
ncbi:MAG TPA: hypothetical protein VMU24_05310 [Candidatus Acidoferrales bacterium]|nr:hypothetical protein [Candidatus Acidoferrales bacterium]